MSSQDVRMANASPERIAALPPQAGEARWWFGGLALIKLDSKQTEGRFSLIEVLWPPNRRRVNPTRACKKGPHLATSDSEEHLPTIF